MNVISGFFPRRSAVAVAAVAALGLAACGAPTDSEPGAATTTETMSASTAGDDIATTTSTQAGIRPAGDADTAMKTLRPEAPGALAVTGVQVASHDGFDRIVFDLTGDGQPGWFIDYTDSPAQQGSGHPVTYQGSTALNFNIDGVSYPFDLGIEDPGLGTVAGAGNVTEVISVGTFEGRSQFVIGLTEQLPYSVQVLEDPQRVVVDILQR